MSKLHELVGIAQAMRAKRAFVDPAAMGGAMPPGAPPMDPAAMGGAMPPGAPPMDPAAMGGGMPPPPPGVTAEEVRAIVQEAMAGAGGAAGGGAAGGMPLKPKIDVNVELMQIKNMLAKIVDAMGIPVPAQDMVATPEKLMAMSQGQSTTTGGAGAGGGSSIPPIEPIAGAAPGMAQKSSAFVDGQPYTDAAPSDLSNRAAALAQLMRARNG